MDEERPPLMVDVAALADLIEFAGALVRAEVRQCQAVYEADSGDSRPIRAEAARRRFPAAPWQFYLDDDAARVALALERLPRVEQVRAAFGL